jgi:hypothetical protein
MTDNTGGNLGNRLYLRIAVKNEGKAAAKNVEVYALQLEQRKPYSDAFYPVSSFPPMNLKWANTPGYHFHASNPANAHQALRRCAHS